MLQKAIFIDYKEGEIEPKYFDRIKKLFSATKFISRDNPNLLNDLKDPEAIFSKISTKIDKDLIDATPQLKYVGVCSTAFDATDAKYARSKGIAVCNLGGYSTEAVAEFFFAALIDYTRELERARQQAKKEDYSFQNFMTVELKDKVLGVIGAGKIGSRIAEIGHGFGMRVVYFSRKNKPEIEKLGAKKIELDEVLKQSDFMDLSLALNSETAGIISKERLNLLKNGATIISLAPPKLMDQEAVMEKAGKGEISYIFDHSDDMDEELVKRFLKYKNCVVYPPVTFRTAEANTARWETFVSNIENFLKGTPQNVVN